MIPPPVNVCESSCSVESYYIYVFLFSYLYLKYLRLSFIIVMLSFPNQEHHIRAYVDLLVEPIVIILSFRLPFQVFSYSTHLQEICYDAKYN